MDINKFLKDYYDICKKHNLQLVATENFTYEVASLNITNLSNDVLNETNVLASDVDVDFSNNRVYYWDTTNKLNKLEEL